jgi:hypothetical protein
VITQPDGDWKQNTGSKKRQHHTSNLLGKDIKKEQSCEKGCGKTN